MAPLKVPPLLNALYRLMFALMLTALCLLWWQKHMDDHTLAMGLLLWLCCFFQGRELLSKGYERYCLKQGGSDDSDDCGSRLSGIMYRYCHDERRYRYLNSAANTTVSMPELPGYCLPGSAFDAMVHPDDRQSLKCARHLALQRGYFEHTYRLVHGATEQQVLDRGVILRRDGRTECHGLLIDISRLEAGSVVPEGEERCSMPGEAASSHHAFSSRHDHHDYPAMFVDRRGSHTTSPPDSKALHRAMKNEQLRLVYQPQVQGNDQHIAGFEVLLRWHHPDYGTIPPSTFIPMAESAEFMPVLGNWVIDRVCRQISCWRSQGYQVPVVAINVSVLQLDRALLAHVATVLERYALDGACLEFEITESRMMQNFDECVHVISRLRQQGIRISLDDFGTGYSSLDKLALLPLDRLKLDKSFVMALPDTHHGYQIIEAIVRLAHSLQLTVVAEGVETRRQQHLLNELGCEILQGYLFGPGVEADKAVRYLKEHQY
ncbi:putative bifunctional diguanylate cyclase/phosphodiesterase [Kushneria marisflavi]|nr:EAL domain-containing protein [Kushneria marisflavi]